VLLDLIVSDRIMVEEDTVKAEVQENRGQGITMTIVTAGIHLEITMTIVTAGIHLED
jgi:hypothetical protein